MNIRPSYPRTSEPGEAKPARFSAIVGWLDSWGHRLHLPDFIQNRLCDAYDRSLGI